MSATTTSPARVRPGSNRCPYLRRPKVTVNAASNDSPRTSPVSPWTPLGTSTATQTRSRAAHASASASGSPSSGRASPAPNSASTTNGSPSSSAGQSGSTGPSQRAAIAAASPLRRSRRPNNPSRTGQPASASSRAATKPSPPLLPGPQSTATGRGAQRRTMACATARPAFSISVSPGVPARAAAASAAYISATEKSARAPMSLIPGRCGADRPASVARRRNRRRPCGRPRRGASRSRSAPHRRHSCCR